MKLTRKQLIKYCLSSVVVRKELFKPFHSYGGYQGIASKFELPSSCMQDVCFVVKIQCTNQRPEKYISSLISLQWDFNLLVCLQKFSFAFHKSLHKSLQLLLKFSRKSYQCVGEVCIFDNPLLYTEFVAYLGKKNPN